MYTKTTYKGILKDTYGIFCGFKPRGLKVQEKILVYYPDEGNIFIKNGEKFTSVVLQPNEFIEEYEEVLNTEEADNDNI